MQSTSGARRRQCEVHDFCIVAMQASWQANKQANRPAGEPSSKQADSLLACQPARQPAQHSTVKRRADDVRRGGSREEKVWKPKPPPKHPLGKHACALPAIHAPGLPHSIDLTYAGPYPVEKRMAELAAHAYYLFGSARLAYCSWGASSLSVPPMVSELSFDLS